MILPSMAPKSRRVRWLSAKSNQIIAGMLDQSATRFHQPLLQAGERPVVDPPGQKTVVGASLLYRDLHRRPGDPRRQLNLRRPRYSALGKPG